jgi:hypothetical protein
MAELSLKQPRADGGSASVIRGVFEKRTKRERVLLCAMAIIAVCATLVCFLVIPGMNRLEDLQAEVTSLENERLIYSTAISQSPVYQQACRDAQSTCDEAKGRLFVPMDPESLDETISGYLISSGFDLTSLAMTPLHVEGIDDFSGIVSKPAIEDGTAAATRSTFAYTVNVTAAGYRSNLYRLLDKIQKTDGVELAAYQFGGAAEGDDNRAAGVTGAKGQSGLPDSEKSTATMTFKVYVFVEGRSASSEAGAQDETEGNQTAAATVSTGGS